MLEAGATRRSAVERGATAAEGGPAWPDRLARYVFGVLLIATALGILGGALSVLEGPSSTPGPSVQDDPCPAPPCFFDASELAGMPPSAVPSLLQLLGYTLAVALGVPGLPAAGRDLLRGRPALAAGRLLAFFGPLLILVGTELVPHLLACALLPWTCEDHPRHGWTIVDQWHQLDHALVGALPLVALYGLALRRWHPALANLEHRKDG